MIRRRDKNTGLPWRVYERFGKRWWRIWYQPPKGKRGTVDDDGFGYFYRYRDGGIDNTARQHGKSFGSKDQALQRAETRLRILRVA